MIVAAIYGADDGGQHARVGLRSGHDQGVGAAILQMPVELMSGEGGVNGLCRTRAGGASAASGGMSSRRRGSNLSRVVPRHFS